VLISITACTTPWHYCNYFCREVHSSPVCEYRCTRRPPFPDYHPPPLPPLLMLPPHLRHRCFCCHLTPATPHNHRPAIPPAAVQQVARGHAGPLSSRWTQLSSGGSGGYSGSNGTQPPQRRRQQVQLHCCCHWSIHSSRCAGCEAGGRGCC
jgi:hypothetical protein